VSVATTSIEREPDGRFKTGRSANPAGRQKGVANKVTGDMRQMLRQALDEEGGVDYLRWAARKQPQAFLALLGRLLPAEVRASLETDGMPLVIVRDFRSRGRPADDDNLLEPVATNPRTLEPAATPPEIMAECAEPEQGRGVAVFDPSDER
jgi:hypothetical protein